jgi:SARP family transcriptional regulator, regulator of embCAB operon
VDDTGVLADPVGGAVQASLALAEAPTNEDRTRRAAQVRLFGALRVVRSDGSEAEASEFRTRKTRHLLRLLALQAGDPIGTSRLVDLLWPAVPESRGRASLRTAASQLRTTLRANHVIRVGDSLQLCDVDVDVLRFQDAATRAQRALAASDHRTGLARTRLALRLYSGPLAEDEPWLDPILQARARLALQLQELLLAAGDAALALGRPHEAIHLAERVLAEDGACERACRQLMHAYGRLSERSMALRVYDRFRRTLAQELGVSPSASTQALHLELIADSDQHDRTA